MAMRKLKVVPPLIPDEDRQVPCLPLVNRYGCLLTPLYCNIFHKNVNSRRPGARAAKKQVSRQKKNVD
jgi:hypothetical protein